jgi:hypothetical protein
MVDPQTVRRLASALPEAEDRSSDAALSFHVRGKQFAWTYLERETPKGPRHPRIDVLAVRCRTEMKQVLLDAEPDKLFTDDHYRSFPAVLVRLAAVDEADLTNLLAAAWRSQAPRDLHGID